MGSAEEGMLRVVPEEYLWIVVLGGVVCFLTAFAIGANDVANTFSSSVGSKAVSLPAAVAAAAALETAAATLLGANVTDSIRSKIIDFEAFSGQESVLMLGMMCALVGSGVWLYLANQFGLPVSTTHSIIGSILGFGFASGNIHSIRWNHICFIFISWLIAPLAAATAGATVFLAIRALILKTNQPLKRAIRSLWFFIWLIVLTFSVFLVLKNPFEIDTTCTQWLEEREAIVNSSPCRISRWASAHMGISLGISFAISVVLTLIISLGVYSFAFYRLRRYRSKAKGAELVETSQLGGIQDTNSCTPHRMSAAGNGGQNAQEGKAVASVIVHRSNEGEEASVQEVVDREESAFTVSSSSESADNEKISFKQRMINTWNSMPWFRDLHAEGMEEADFVERLQNDVEAFDVETELFFSACQVASACMGCIAHSANDTANAVGPFAAILTIYQHGIGSSVTCPWYILLFGGIAMSLGLALLGYRVIKTVGVKLVKITPARGFSMEIGAAWTVLVFSAIGIPLSTTHCAVGSTVGVGLLEPKKKSESLKEGIKRCPPRVCCFLNTSSVNWKLFGGMIASWIVTILFSSVVSAALFSFAAYSPHISL